MRPPPLGIRGAAPPAPGPGGRSASPRDSSRAMKMLVRRPPPSTARLVRLAEPLVPGSRYVVKVLGVRGLSGPPADVRGQFPVPVPKPPSRSERTRAAGDTLHPAADTLHPAADTTRPRPPVSDTAASRPAAPDTTRRPAPDTTRPAVPPPRPALPDSVRRPAPQPRDTTRPPPPPAFRPAEGPRR